jgi:hypothetical protein
MEKLKEGETSTSTSKQRKGIKKVVGDDEDDLEEDE